MPYIDGMLWWDEEYDFKNVYIIIIYLLLPEQD